MNIHVHYVNLSIDFFFLLFPCYFLNFVSKSEVRLAALSKSASSLLPIISSMSGCTIISSIACCRLTMNVISLRAQVFFKKVNLQSSLCNDRTTMHYHCANRTRRNLAWRPLNWVALAVTLLSRPNTNVFLRLSYWRVWDALSYGCSVLLISSYWCRLIV